MLKMLVAVLWGITTLMISTQLFSKHMDIIAFYHLHILSSWKYSLPVAILPRPVKFYVYPLSPFIEVIAHPSQGSEDSKATCRDFLLLLLFVVWGYIQLQE